MGSGFRTFAAGEVLTASNVNNYLMEQTVMSFATTAARDAAITVPEEGMFAYTQDTDSYWSYSGGAWVSAGTMSAWISYTPVWTSAGTAVALGNATITGKYMKIGRMVTYQATLVMGSTSTYGTGQYSLTLPPFTAVTTQTQFNSCHVFDTSTADHWFGGSSLSSGTTAGLFAYIGTAIGTLKTVTNNQPISGGWGTGDNIHAYGTYEATS